VGEMDLLAVEELVRADWEKKTRMDLQAVEELVRTLEKDGLTSCERVSATCRS
jgi:hypothetical protein